MCPFILFSFFWALEITWMKFSASLRFLPRSLYKRLSTVRSVITVFLAGSVVVSVFRVPSAGAMCTAEANHVRSLFTCLLTFFLETLEIGWASELLFTFLIETATVEFSHARLISKSNCLVSAIFSMHCEHFVQMQPILPHLLLFYQFYNLCIPGIWYDIPHRVQESGQQ